MNQEDRKQWKQYINEKAAVNLSHNNDTGEWLYSVEVVESDGFWLASYKTKRAAQRFVERHQLPVITNDANSEVSE